MPINKKLFSKVVMIAFLLMIVVGFTVPLFDLGGQPPEQQGQPRLCQSDTDCYLVCNGAPETVLCSQNLCVKNSCEEYNLFTYREQPVTFSFTLALDDKEIRLAERSNSKDLFVTLNGSSVEVHSPQLNLAHVLEKAGMVLTGPCVTFDGQQYCSDGEKTLRLLVNGQEEFAPQYYVPQEGDIVEVVYS